VMLTVSSVTVIGFAFTSSEPAVVAQGSVLSMGNAVMNGLL